MPRIGSGGNWDPGRWWNYTWGNYTWCYTITTIMSYSYLMLHCYHHELFIKMGSDESHSNVLFIVRGKDTRWCWKITTFEEKGEPKQGIKHTSSTSQPNAALLDQTGSHSKRSWIWNSAVNLKPEDFQAPQRQRTIWPCSRKTKVVRTGTWLVTLASSFLY